VALTSSDVWAGISTGGFATLVAYLGYLKTRRTASVDREQGFRDDLLQRIDQQDRQLHQCEEDHRKTRVDLEALRQQHHVALELIDQQTGNIRRLEERVAILTQRLNNPA
jgi:chromosome segregation ATPase